MLDVPLGVTDLADAISRPPDEDTAGRFVPSPHIRRLDLTVDVDRLRRDAERLLGNADDQGEGFHTRLLTRRPGVDRPVTSDELSGRYWTRTSDGDDVAHEPLVDESRFTELDPSIEGTSVAEVIELLRSWAPIGRVRLLGKDPFNANSWHRDPEPRLHIPIVADPGSLFVVANHVTHLPADGSVYFTDTRAFHTAMNGGRSRRLSLVAAIAVSTASESASRLNG